MDSGTALRRVSLSVLACLSLKLCFGCYALDVELLGDTSFAKLRMRLRLYRMNEMI